MFSQDNDGSSLLSKATSEGLDKAVKTLLNAGVEVNQQNEVRGSVNTRSCIYFLKVYSLIMKDLGILWSKTIKNTLIKSN